jgi:hypothetical protein
MIAGFVEAARLLGGQLFAIPGIKPIRGHKEGNVFLKLI